jgi:hypothetical protein
MHKFPYIIDIHFYSCLSWHSGVFLGRYRASASPRFSSHAGLPLNGESRSANPPVIAAQTFAVFFVAAFLEIHIQNLVDVPAGLGGKIFFDGGE